MANATIPVLRSKEQIIGDLIDGFLARVDGVNDLNRMAVLIQFFVANGQDAFKAYADIVAMIDANNINRAVGAALQRLAADNNVPIFSASQAVTNVNITDLTFTQIQSVVYAGQPAPVAGVLTLYVADASAFPAGGGQLYIGVNTPNYEGPLTYTAVTQLGGGSYWAITLSSNTPTTRFHNIGETVLLAQGGNRIIQAGTIVQTGAATSVTAVQFTTSANATIPDGQVTVSQVPVICTEAGTIGNVPAGAIVSAKGLPFNSSVTNPSSVFSGRPDDTNDTIRARIIAYNLAKSNGTEAAIEAASQNVVSPDDMQQVTSSNVVRYADGSAALIFDNGQGYQPLFYGQGYEIIINSAVGGEINVPIRNVPAAQALVISTATAPYDIAALSFLSCTVAGMQTTHQFVATDFQVLGSGTAQEVAQSINNDPNINFLASAIRGSSQVIVYPRNVLANDITVVPTTAGVDANTILEFPNTIAYSFRLYKNNVPLYEQGIIAQVSSIIQPLWSPSIEVGDTLEYQVDNTSPITITLTADAFEAIDPLSNVNYATAIATWAAVLNDLMTGVNVTVNGQQLTFSSNRGANNAAQIAILGGTLMQKMFQQGIAISSIGQTSDYTANLNTGQIGLAEPLEVGDQLTLGSQFTRGHVTTTNLASGPSTSGNAWFIVDGTITSVPNGFSSNTQVEFTKVGTKLTITAQSPLAVPQGFDQVQPGDWLLIWSNPTDPAALISNSGFWRVETVEVGQIVVDDGINSRSNLGTFVTPLSNRIVIVRSPAPMQQLSFSINSLDDFADQVQSILVGVEVDIVGSTVRISTETYGTNGSIYVVAVDAGGTTLGLPVGQASDSVSSHYGFNVTSDSEAGLPNFTFSTFGTEITSSIYDEPHFAEYGGIIDEFVEILNRYDVATLTQTPDSNKGTRVFVVNFNETNDQLTLLPPDFMGQTETPIKAADRYFARQSYQFDSSDNVTVIVDNNDATESFVASVARQLLVSSAATPSTQSFSASDNQSSLALNNSASFLGFNFANFKAWRQAYTTLTDGTYTLSVKANDYGPVGNRFRVGFVYPNSASQTALSSNFINSEIIDLQIVLPVITTRTPTWDHTTSFVVSVSTVGGKDLITYQWEAGTQPNFGIGGSAVNIGDIAIISSSASFLPGNDGYSAQVVAVTPTSFTVQRPTGTAVSDTVLITNILNQNGIITINTNASDSLISGDTIGLYGTASPNGGSSYPFNTTYQVTTTGPSSFTIPTPASVPGGAISSGTFVNNVVTITTSNPHGLQAGDAILISGTSSSYDGLVAVYNVVNPNQFQFIKSGSFPAIAGIGRFDFQSYGITASVAIATVTQAGYYVTVNTASNHGLTPGELVQIQNVVINNWNIGTTYEVGDIVTDTINSLLYVSTTIGNVGNQPSTSPSDWSPTTLDYSGTFVVDTTPTLTQFNFYYLQNDTGNNTAGTGGTSAGLLPQASLARALNGQTNENLVFAQVGTTAQAVADFATNNLAGELLIVVANGNTSAMITESTEDEGAATNYLSGNVNNLAVTISQQLIVVTVNNAVPAGSTINISGLTGGNAVYNGTYAVITSAPSVYIFGQYDLQIQSSVFAAASSSASVSGAYTGSTPYNILIDGENSIATSNVSAIGPTPMFVLKYPWYNAPAIGEQIRLVATNSDQVTRFWNQLVVTGLTNVTTIQNSQIGRQVEITTNTFGGSGAVQVVGGTANAVSAALIGSASDNNNRYGLLNIPYDLRTGFTARQWLNVQNTVTQNKSLGFDPTTVLTVLADGIEITGGAGTFQTERATTQDATTTLKLERHGNFMAFITINGTSMGLATGGVKEGDWVVVQNIQAALWNPSTSYTTGQQVNFNGTNYTALSNNTGHEPDTSPIYWQIQQFDPANIGIYQVVRTFGQDAFWVIAPQAVEEMIILGNAGNLAFYSYDSVMPGDVLVIATNALGTSNVGQYTVLSNANGPSYSFPSATRIWTQTIPNPPGSPVTLGTSAQQVNVLEKNPISLWKRVFALGPANGGLANVIVDTPNLVTKLSSSLGAYITGEGKLNYDNQVHFGADSYKYYGGLVKTLNQVIYGDPTQPLVYPGIRAAGTNVRIMWALLYRTILGIAIRVQNGVPFDEVSDQITASIAGYVNGLNVGEAVSLSQVIGSAQTVPGVTSVAITAPTYNAANDQIAIGANQRAAIINSLTDVTVSQIGES